MIDFIKAYFDVLLLVDLLIWQLVIFYRVSQIKKAVKEILNYVAVKSFIDCL